LASSSAPQIGAGVGQPEAGALAQVPGVDDGDARAPGWHLAQIGQQRGRIGAHRMPEEDLAAVALLAGPAVDCPGAVARREFEPLGQAVGLPGRQGAREGQFLERRAQPALQARQRLVGVERAERGLVGVGQQRLALDELPLRADERGQPVVVGAQRREFVGDAEQRADEGVEVGRQGEQEIGLGPVGQRLRIATGVGELLLKRRTGGCERLAKGRVDAQQAVAPVQVLEPQSEGQTGHQRSRYWSLSLTSFQSSASVSAGFVRVMLGHVLASSALSATNFC
jgi:hypothetical protein